MKTNIVSWMLAAASIAEGQGTIALPGAGNVALPLDEYNRLVELATKPATKPVNLPTAFAIQRAEMKFEVSTSHAFGTIQLEGEVFGTGEVKVPLISGVALLGSRQDGRELPLHLEGASHAAMLNGPGPFSIALDAGVPIVIEAGRASLTLPVPAAGTVRLTLVLPGDHTNVNLAPGLITSRSSSGGRTVIEATLTGGQPATFWWATRESIAQPAAAREARFLSDVKTVITVGEASVVMAALIEIAVVQGEPAQFEIELPGGYEVTGVSGPTLESSETQSTRLLLKVNGASRSHQVLISLERSVTGAKEEVGPPSMLGAQRETGELLVEGEGTMELSATEAGGLKRMDFKEANPYLRSLARHSVYAAFRYHRQPGETPRASLEWVRFPDTGLLAAVAQSAAVTTLVTTEGRSLTEVKLTLRNRQQPFLKVALPPGASIVSADVAGEAVKPVLGADGARVPLLRAGFRPTGAYTVSFVFLHSGTPFAKKGASELLLPKMDMPIGLLEWEVFMPNRLQVRDFGGDPISAALLPRSAGAREGGEVDLALMTPRDFPRLGLGQIGGFILDPAGAVIPRATVTAVHAATGTSRRAVTEPNGQWAIVGMPAGRIKITAFAPGFNVMIREIEYEPSRLSRVDVQLQVGSVSESVTVASDSSLDARQKESAAFKDQPTQASLNVLNLQRRVAGVLPIHVDIPRTGNSYRFARPLVQDDETRLTFNYKASR